MELVYLWVENYKNIRNQGFNFSPRFECKFDENTKELTITENKNYVSIFPKNINITAIVGENGSGKSSIGGSFITKYFIAAKGDEKNILIFFHNKKLYTYNTTIIEIVNNTNYDKETEPLNDFRKDINNIFQIKSEKEINKLSLNSILQKELDFLIKKGLTGNTLIKKMNNIGFYDKKSDRYNLSRYLFSVLSEFSSRDNHLTGNTYRSIRPLERTDINNFKSFGNDIKLLNDIIDLLGFKHKADSYEKEIKFSIMKNDIRFGELSFGEKYAIHLLSSLYIRITNNIQSIIFLDEVTLSMHPSLEKNFINVLLKIVQKASENSEEQLSVHFIITSHSPFILSDLQKENIIFLKNGKVDNPDIKQTFGANIHTLLSDGFFMSDGLMGEFAKNKIKTIQITYKYILHRHKQKSLNKKEHKKSRRFIKTQLKMLWHIQSIIGERFLQTIMKNYLQEIEEILFGNEKAIENEIERLENLKQSIKNVKNQKS